MSEFYLNQKIKYEEKRSGIIEILKARGFLIEEAEGKYYLSDNASMEDLEYLKKGLKEYNLGEVFDSHEYIKVRRRDWQPGPNKNYEYYSILPRTVEIVLDDNASIDLAIEFFHGYGQIGGEACTEIYPWERFIIESLGRKAPVGYLEAYVALYVKAVSACGVYTSASCDGNHEKGGEVYVTAHYPTNLWHECLWKYLVQKKYGTIPFIGTGIHFDENTKEKVYCMLYDIANFLYENRIIIRKLKDKCTENLTKEYLKKHSPKEVELFFCEECRSVLDNDVLELE